jgi:hypothetical protein
MVTCVSQVNLKVLIDADLKARLDQLLERKRISLTAGVDAMVGWLLEQDSLLQSAVLGQVEPKDRADVARLVLKRMAGEDRAAEPPAPLPGEKRDVRRILQRLIEQTAPSAEEPPAAPEAESRHVVSEEEEERAAWQPRVVKPKAKGPGVEEGRSTTRVLKPKGPGEGKG